MVGWRSSEWIAQTAMVTTQSLCAEEGPSSIQLWSHVWNGNSALWAVCCFASNWAEPFPNSWFFFNRFFFKNKMCCFFPFCPKTLQWAKYYKTQEHEGMWKVWWRRAGSAAHTNVRLRTVTELQEAGTAAQQWKLNFLSCSALFRTQEKTRRERHPESHSANVANQQ